jgi:hypothetical protein
MAENLPKPEDNKPLFNFAFDSPMMRPRNRGSTPDSSDDEGPRPQTFRARQVNLKSGAGGSGVFSTTPVSASVFSPAPSTAAQAPAASFSAFHRMTSLAPGTQATGTSMPSASVPSALFPSTLTAAPPAPVSTFQNPSQGSQLLGSLASTTQKPSAPIPADAAPKAMAQTEDARLFAAHMALLSSDSSLQNQHEVSSTPLFTKKVLDHSRSLFSQYGFLAGLSNVLDSNAGGNPDASRPSRPVDPRLFFNISAPSSAFICGSQGSGKSHTLSCLLENCLMKSDISMLDSPLAALVFHYDSFTSDIKGTPCEAAHLSSNPNIKVRVLCSPTNINSIKVRSFSQILFDFQLIEYHSAPTQV